MKQDFKTFEDFRAAENAVAIFFGDWGGQVYATVPMRLFSADVSPEDFRQLAIRLEEVCWSCNVSTEDPAGGAMLNFDVQEPNTGVLGGMGGGWVGEDAWINPDLPDKAREFIREKLSDVS